MSIDVIARKLALSSQLKQDWLTQALPAVDFTLGAIRPTIVVSGLVYNSTAAAASNLTKINAAITKAKNVKWAYGVLIPGSSGGISDILYINDAIQCAGDGAYVEYDTQIKLTKSDWTAFAPTFEGNTTNKTNSTIFQFGGFLVGTGTKYYQQRPVLRARRPGLWLDGNGAAYVTAGFRYDVNAGVTGSPLVHFNGCESPWIENVWTKNSLGDGIIPAYCPNGRARNCVTTDTKFDNGIYVFNNAEHVRPVDFDNQRTWSNFVIENHLAYDCHNHGIGSWGSIGVTVINPKWFNCGNDSGVQGGGGTAGGLGLEYASSTNSDKDHRFTVIGGNGRDCYGFVARTNCHGMRLIRTQLGKGKKPANWARATCSVTGTVLTVTSIDSQGSGWTGLAVHTAVGDASGAIAWPVGAEIVSQVSGTAGGVGVYNLSHAPTAGNFTAQTVSLGFDDNTSAPIFGCSLFVQGGGTVTGDVNLEGFDDTAAIVMAGTTGKYPTVALKMRARDAKKLVRSYGIGELTIESGSLIRECGDSANTANHALIDVTNSSLNTGAGRVNLSGEWRDNYGYIAGVNSIGELNVTSASGDNNQRALASAYHMFYASGTLPTLRFGHVQFTNGSSGKCARLIHAAGNVGVMIGDQHSVVGPMSSAGQPPVSCAGTVTTYLCDRFEALAGAKPSYAPAYVGQRVIDTTGNREWVARAFAAATDWIATSGPDTASTASLQSATNSINTIGKYQSKPCYCTSINKILYATGATSTSTWVDATGTVVYTPA